MAYREYSNGASLRRQHNNGHVARSAQLDIEQPSISERIEQRRQAQRLNIQTLAESLLEMMDERDYWDFIDTLPDDYAGLVAGMEKKLSELEAANAH